MCSPRPVRCACEPRAASAATRGVGAGHPLADAPAGRERRLLGDARATPIEPHQACSVNSVAAQSAHGPSSPNGRDDDDHERGLRSARERGVVERPGRVDDDVGRRRSSVEHRGVVERADDASVSRC